METDLQNDIAAIKSQLSDINENLEKFIERSNQQHLESILDGCRNNFSEVIIGYSTGEIERGLEKNMVKGCHMRDACKSIFSGLLKRNIEQIKDGKVPEESINKARSKMKELRDKAQYDHCGICFSEASRIFDKQIDLMRSLKIYREESELKDAISTLPVEHIVEEMLEPLGNKQRMQIMKALSAETKTFSALSSLTGLRGGNLLFHLQKLMDSKMILQRNERGDYMITEKGYKTLRGIFETYLHLESQEIIVETTKSLQVLNA
jgi:DNA-binding transcriptional ArsR family regulator